MLKQEKELFLQYFPQLTNHLFTFVRKALCSD
jgi:hypothetical protein